MKKYVELVSILVSVLPVLSSCKPAAPAPAPALEQPAAPARNITLGFGVPGLRERLALLISNPYMNQKRVEDYDHLRFTCTKDMEA